jgi:hypothetical protein
MGESAALKTPQIMGARKRHLWLSSVSLVKIAASPPFAGEIRCYTVQAALVRRRKNKEIKGLK